MYITRRVTRTTTLTASKSSILTSSTTVAAAGTTHRRFNNSLQHKSSFSSQRTMASDASRLSHPLPKGAWDSHMHIVEPEKYPLSPTAKYTPHPHTLTDAQKFYTPLGIQNLVLVQPSIYATDNSCMLQALRDLGPSKSRAIVELNPSKITTQTLQEWHDLGVRGVRVNLVSVGRDLSNENDLRSELEAYANVIRPMKSWVLQVYIPMTLAIPLERIVPDLGVKFCIDHFGSPVLPSSSFSSSSEPSTDDLEGYDPYETLSGFKSLINLLKTGKVWIKLSAPYRLSKDPQLRDLNPIGKELVRQAPDHIVYATDWPHTRFENIDSIPFIEMCYRWCGGGDTELAEKLFTKNAEVLWDV